MVDELIGEQIVVDLRSHYVCLGTLTRITELYLELTDADLHDFRDTRTSREIYVADSQATGIKRNRERVFLARAEVVAISRLKDVAVE